ncbi:Protein of unknown function [Gryllus bimaculatus]|nr:Protein of unknown function [Gryllus bimaculatus]
MREDAGGGVRRRRAGEYGGIVSGHPIKCQRTSLRRRRRGRVWRLEAHAALQLHRHAPPRLPRAPRAARLRLHLQPRQHRHQRQLGVLQHQLPTCAPVNTRNDGGPWGRGGVVANPTPRNELRVETVSGPPQLSCFGASVVRVAARRRQEGAWVAKALGGKASGRPPAPERVARPTPPPRRRGALARQAPRPAGAARQARRHQLGTAGAPRAASLTPAALQHKRAATSRRAGTVLPVYLIELFDVWWELAASSKLHWGPVTTRGASGERERARESGRTCEETREVGRAVRRCAAFASRRGRRPRATAAFAHRQAGAAPRAWRQLRARLRRRRARPLPARSAHAPPHTYST